MKKYDERFAVRRTVDGIPVKLTLQKRIAGFDVEKPWWTLCWRTNYSVGGSNRRFYISKGDCWVIPADIALEMIDEMESLGGLHEGYFDHRGGTSPPEFLVSTEMANALEGITGPDEDWGVYPFFVICSDPSREWKKVLLINTETNIATFRSITENPSYKPKKVLRPNAGWWLDNSMMDANVQQMRVFHSQLKQYLSRK